MSVKQSDNNDTEKKLFIKDNVNPSNINNYIIIEKYKKQQHYLNKLLLPNYNNDEIKNIKLPTSRYENMKKIEQEDLAMINELNSSIHDLSNKLSTLNDENLDKEIPQPNINSYKIKDINTLVKKVTLSHSKTNDTKVSDSYWDNEYKQYYIKVKEMKEQLAEQKRQQYLKEQAEEELKQKQLQQQKQQQLQFQQQQQQQQSMFNNPMMGLYGMDLDLNFNKPDNDPTNIMVNHGITNNSLPVDSFVMGNNSNSIDNGMPQANLLHQQNQQEQQQQQLPSFAQPITDTKLPSSNDNDFLMDDFEFDDLDLPNANSFGHEFNDDELDPAFF